MRFRSNLMGLADFILQLKGKKPINWTFIEVAKQLFQIVDMVDAMLDSSDGAILLGNIYGFGTSELRYDRPGELALPEGLDRKSVVSGKRVDLGGGRLIKKQKFRGI